MNPLRPAILAAARSPRVERLVTRAPVSRDIVRRFVAGSTRTELLPVIERLLASGRYVSVDYLGEDTTDRARAEATVVEYLALIDDLAGLPGAAAGPDRAGGSPARLEVSVKLSALGQALPVDGERIATESVRRICARAAAAGVWVTVDMEDHTTTDSTLAVVRSLRAEFPWLGAVLQAYLRRTEDDCRAFSGRGSRIRLCKGAYREPAGVAYQERAKIDDSYRRCLAVLFGGDGYPMIATHDPALIAEVSARTGRAGYTSNRYEHQMLFGIQEREQIRLVDSGVAVRVYVPYGDQWFGYFMRRIAERPANMRFFLRSLVNRG